MSPVWPNNIAIRHVTVSGGMLSSPLLTTTTGTGMKHTMAIAQFQIRYHVPDCEVGIEVIQSNGSDAEKVEISRVSMECFIHILLLTGTKKMFIPQYQFFFL